MNQATDQPKTAPQSRARTTKQDLLRWTVPPGVSIGVHAALIGVIAYIGLQISATEAPADRLPMAELALPASTSLPEAEKSNEHTPSPSASRNLVPTPAAPSELDNAAADLGSLKFTKPVMDPVALESLRTSNAQISRPESATPPAVRFAGVQTQAARTIVYVVDGSGATANSFSYLQTQLLVSIDRLSPTQRFQVVLFRSFDEHTITHAPINTDRLARATPKNKQRVSDWLDTITSRGRSNPVAGLHAALALKPDLVLLITRSIHRTEMGWAQGQRAILQELNVLNPQNPKTGRRKTVIKTIQLLDEDPTGIMLAIGTFHGDGNDDYRVVTYDDLVSPDEPDDLNQRSLGASNEQRISTASELMGTLAASGASFSLFYARCDLAQREQAIKSARQIRSLVSRLIGVDGRAAILDAQAILILEIANPGSASKPQLNAIITSLDGVMYTEPNTDAQRVLTVALAMVRLDRIDEASDRVEELLALADDLDLDPSTRAQAVLALVAMGRAPANLGALESQMPFVTANGSIDAVWGLILRETMTNARLKYRRPEPWLPMTSIRHSARNNESIANYIDTRIALILQSSGSPARDQALPSAVLLAAANTMAHSMDNRERAMELLSEIALRDHDPAQASDALWRIGVLGRAINTSEALVRSSDALTELATRYPEHTHGADAIAGAIFATPIHQEDLQRDRLKLAVAQFPNHPQIDLWRLDLAELLSDFEALAVLDPITPNTREGVLAGELYEQIVLGMLDRYTDGQVRRGLGIRMRDAAERFDLAGAQMWTKRAAMNEIELDPQSAIASIDQLIVDARAQNQPTAELELMRAQTLAGLGQTRTAFEALSALSTRIDTTGNHTSTYWQAWALMLETIVDAGSQGDKADAVRHIARLELIDPNLGGSPWRQRIIAARQTLH